MTTEINDDLAEVLAEVLADSNPLDAFNECILSRVDWSRTLHDGSHPGQHWWAQRQILKALWDPEIETVVVPAGHSVGKSYVGADVVLGWPTLHPDGLVVSTSPSNTQLSGVLWKEVRKARSRSPIMSRIGRITQLPNRFSLEPGWEAIGYATNKAERLQGWHSQGPLLVLVDEASGIEDADIWSTLESLKPTKKLLLGNPLRDHGMFYETCRRADDGDKTVKKIWIPSTFSPDIGIPRSERGLADAKFLANMIAQYGEDSQTFRVRVKALFPDSSADALVPGTWLDLAEKAVHQPGGPRRLAIDVAEGNDGDEAVLVVRDDNGILHFEASRRWNFEAQASKAAQLCQRFGILPGDVSYDGSGSGADFGNRLEQVGIFGARRYQGGRSSKSPKWDLLRSACYWALRRRLDPNWREEDRAEKKPQFSIPREFMARLRAELREVTYETGGHEGRTIIVRPGVDVRAALRHSPDFADALSQSFMSK